MMIDYNVRDDWPADEPTWTKALVSSLDRRHGEVSVLPLTVVAQEILNWINVASGEEAWDRPANRQSLLMDLEQSAAALGASTAHHLATYVSRLKTALRTLDQAKKDVTGVRILQQRPGTRTDPAWVNVQVAATALLAELATDASVTACWADLVDCAHRPNLNHREYRPAADLLYEQLRLRRNESDRIFSELVSMLAYGRSRRDSPLSERSMPAEDRLNATAGVVLAQPDNEHVVVWLGYVGARVDTVEAGNVIFMDAHWHVPNAQPEGQDFPHKDELTKIVGSRLFTVAERIDEQSDVDMIVRVDLGSTVVAGATERAVAAVEALLSVSIHWSNGVRPLLAQTVVVRNGELGQSTMHSTATSFSNDYHGVNITGEAIEAYAPRLGSALAKAELPRYLAAAVDAQTAADMPFSRAMALYRPTEGDVRGVIPLQDRVVQHVAAYAGLTPASLSERLVKLWPHSRWRTEADNAVRACLLGGGANRDQIASLRGEYYAADTRDRWAVFVTGREHDLLNVCRVESERAWVTRMVRSISDPAKYGELITEYTLEAKVLAGRRVRVRNALVHGNPVEMQVVRTVSAFASFLSRYALHVGLDSFMSGNSVADILDRELEEATNLLGRTSVADYWRMRAAQRAHGAVTVSRAGR